MRGGITMTIDPNMIGKSIIAKVARINGVVSATVVGYSPAKKYVQLTITSSEANPADSCTSPCSLTCWYAPTDITIEEVIG